MVVHEGNNEISMEDEELDEMIGFNRDLNGAQFPLINGMDGNKNGVNEGVKDCLDKENRCHSDSGNKDNADGNEEMNGGNDNAIRKNKGVGEVNGKEGSDNSSATKFFAKSLVDIVNSSGLDNKLINVPTRVSENGDDVVIFDDEIIKLGNNKWNLTMCGQFIECSMGFNEARYHIRRMWSRLGLREVIAENGVFYFKFQDEEGIKK
nr:RNA-directed DNA polymerase, eukaryota, reverse transcriptase zinc-binding domain protein [Tanacetum cinerariifolium]